MRKLTKKQHGCFTAAQAIDIGYADSVHLYHVKNGQWTRVFRGVYRLSDFPETPLARGMAALLWTRDKNGKIQGVLDPDTAEALRTNRLDAAQPIRISVPKRFRRSSKVPEGIEISVGERNSHKTSKNSEISVQGPIPEVENAVPPGLDAPDYYDWIDYQAVLCRKTT